jgi:hypothetical protein
MTSQRQAQANKSNAFHSTGPRTSLGKRRAGGNALKHGFSASAIRDPGLHNEIARLADAMHLQEGPGSKPEQTFIIAETAFALARIRRVRAAIWEQANFQTVPNTSHSSHSCGTPTLVFEQLERLERYERAMLARRKHARRIQDQTAGQLLAKSQRGPSLAPVDR